MPSSRNGLPANQSIAIMLQEVADDPSTSQNYRYTLKRAIRAIKVCATPIRTKQEALAVPGVGQHLATMIAMHVAQNPELTTDLAIDLQRSQPEARTNGRTKSGRGRGGRGGRTARSTNRAQAAREQDEIGPNETPVVPMQAESGARMLSQTEILQTQQRVIADLSFLSDDENPTLNTAGRTTTRGRRSNTGNSTGGTREYIPKYRSAPFGLLIALLRADENGQIEGLRKDDLCRSAQEFCDHNMNTRGTDDPTTWYSGWASMNKTLCRKGLVSKFGNPPLYKLTLEGKQLARRLEKVHLKAAARSLNEYDEQQNFTYSQPPPAASPHQLNYGVHESEQGRCTTSGADDAQLNASFGSNADVPRSSGVLENHQRQSRNAVHATSHPVRACASRGGPSSSVAHSQATDAMSSENLAEEIQRDDTRAHPKRPRTSSTTANRKRKMTAQQLERATKVVQRLEALGHERGNIISIIEVLHASKSFPRTSDSLFQAVVKALGENDKEVRSRPLSSERSDVTLSLDGEPEALDELVALPSRIVNPMSPRGRRSPSSRVERTNRSPTAVARGNGPSHSKTSSHRRNREPEIIVLDDDSDDADSSATVNEVARKRRLANVIDVPRPSQNTISDTLEIFDGPPLASVSPQSSRRRIGSYNIPRPIQCNNDDILDLVDNSPLPAASEVNKRQNNTERRAPTFGRSRSTEVSATQNSVSNGFLNGTSRSVVQTRSARPVAPTFGQNRSSRNSPALNPPGKRFSQINLSPQRLGNAMNDHVENEPAIVDVERNNLGISGSRCRIILILDNMERFRGSNTRAGHVKCPAELLREENIVVEVLPLPVGDALFLAEFVDGTRVVLDYIIERKTIEDYVASMRDGRVSRQTYLMAESGMKQRILLLEGDEKDCEKLNERPELHKKLAKMTVSSEYYVKQTRDIQDTVFFYASLFRRLCKKFERTAKEALLKSHSQFSEWNNGMKILKRSHTVEQLFLLQLCHIEGVGQTKARNVIQMGYRTSAALHRAYMRMNTMEERDEMLNKGIHALGSKASRAISGLFNRHMYATVMRPVGEDRRMSDA